MLGASQIRQQLARLAQDELSLNQFERWIDPFVWDISPDAEELMESIQSLFSERNERRLNAAQLRLRLLALNNNAVFSISFNHASINPLLSD